MSHFKDGNEEFSCSLEATVHFDFEAMLRKHFGLVGEFNSQEYKDAQALEDDDARCAAFDAILDKSGPEGYYTKEAWDAWQRALDFIDDLEHAGIIDDEIHSRITSCFCDNA